MSPAITTKKTELGGYDVFWHKTLHLGRVEKVNMGYWLAEDTKEVNQGVYPTKHEAVTALIPLPYSDFD